MKNLILQRLLACEVSELHHAEWFCVNPSSNHRIVFFYKHGCVFKLCSKTSKILAQYCLAEIYPTDVPNIIELSYNSITGNVYLVFTNGDIVMIENEKFDFVGDVPSGLLAMEWSPDEELVVLISGENKAIIMTSTFDLIVEVDIHQEGFGEKQFVTVGWGKKETQFHGSEGKAAARNPTQLQPTPAFDWDDKQPRVRWRGDGTLFAISTIEPNSGARQFRVFSREGALQSTSEVVPGLEYALDWKPSGSIIASTQRLPNKHIVALFEKNGLRHGDFTLPFTPKQVTVRKLNWNCDSSVLAVWSEGLEDSELCSLQLWAATNYHWHLKQEIDFPPDRKLRAFHWDKDRALSLHLIQEGGKYFEYSWIWGISHSVGSTEDDVAAVAVMDGRQVKMSNFRESVIPPPMCSYSVRLPATVTNVVFASPCDVLSSNDLCLVLNNNSIAFFSQTAEGNVVEGLNVESAENGGGFLSKGLQLSPLRVYPLQWSDEVERLCYHSAPLALHHWLWIKPDLLLCVAPALCCSSLLLVIEISSDSALIRQGNPVDDPVLGLATLPGEKDVVVFTEKTFLRWQDPLHDGSLLPLETTRASFDQVAARCQQYSVFNMEGEPVVIGLTSMGHLYVDNAVTLKNCSSFFVHSEFLLLTTYQHQLLSIPRTSQALALLKSQGQLADGTERQIERGARLVVAVPRHTRVVLQMPRGNLEAIQPRALALHIVQRLLDQTRYAEAFDLMRRQRINLNVFYDHNPKAFLENLKEFVNQVKNPTWLCLFITDLMEADVTQSMYAGHYPGHVSCSPEAGVPKLDLVSTRMRQALLETDMEKLLLPVITTYIKQTIPDIGAALQYIRNTRMLEQEGKKPAVSSDEALNYLFYIVDVYELFDVALGLYDFDLVMMVAAKSQKDPKEYLPFLNELRKLEENYRKYTIDKHLKKYESALKHLSLCDNQHLEECMTFIQTHKLHAAALKILTTSHVLYQRVCKSYGEALLAAGKYEEAGIMFCRSISYSQAVDAFKRGGAWRKLLGVVPKLQLSDDELTALYKDVAHSLREQRRHLDSAAVFGEYLHDSEERIVSLCMARAWDDAIRVATSHKMNSLVERSIRPGIIEHHEYILTQLVTWQSQLNQYTARLMLVRQEKATRLEQEGDEVAPDVDCDMFSDTSSIMGSTKSRSSGTSSRGTGKTYRSSKNKRKHERKLLSLKEGSAYEDLALVRALHEMYTRTYQLREEVHALCLSLLHFEMDNKASELQTRLTELLSSMEAKQVDIWIPELAQNRAAALKCLGPDSTSNALAAVMQTNHASLAAAAELEPHLCLPPTLAPVSWKLQVIS